MALERNFASVVRFLICVKWYQSFGYFLMLAGDDDGLEDLYTRIDTIEGEISAIKSTFDNIVQELKRLCLKID